MKKEQEIVFTNDIIKKVAKDLEISESKVKAVYDTLFLYLKYLVDFTDAVAIFIPYIGTLYMKVSFLFKKIELYKSDEKYKDKLEIFLKKKVILDEHIQSTIENKQSKSRHLSRNNIDKFRYNAGKTIQEIEEIQNNRSDGKSE